MLGQAAADRDQSQQSSCPAKTRGLQILATTLYNSSSNKDPCDLAGILFACWFSLTILFLLKYGPYFCFQKFRRSKINAHTLGERKRQTRRNLRHHILQAGKHGLGKKLPSRPPWWAGDQAKLNLWGFRGSHPGCPFAACILGTLHWASGSYSSHGFLPSLALSLGFLSMGALWRLKSDVNLAEPWYPGNW